MSEYPQQGYNKNQEEARSASVEQLKQEVDQMWREKKPPAQVIFDSAQTRQGRRSLLIGKAADGREVRASPLGFPMQLNTPVEASYEDEEAKILVAVPYKGPFEIDRDLCIRLGSAGASAGVITETFLQLDFPKAPLAPSHVVEQFVSPGVQHWKIFPDRENPDQQKIEFGEEKSFESSVWGETSSWIPADPQPEMSDEIRRVAENEFDTSKIIRTSMKITEHP